MPRLPRGLLRAPRHQHPGVDVPVARGWSRLVWRSHGHPLPPCSDVRRLHHWLGRGMQQLAKDIGLEPLVNFIRQVSLLDCQDARTRTHSLLDILEY